METLKRIAFKGLSLLFFVSTFHLFGQNKAPVAEDDFSTAFALQPDTIRVLQNDFSWGGHDFKIFQASDPVFGKSTNDDSLIYYTPSMYFQGIDSLFYYIIDLETGQLSAMATVRIDVENAGFDYLDINNVRCRINAWGLQFWDMNQQHCFEVPANSGKSTIYSSALWLGGLDEDNLLHLAGERYRTYGCDFFPGPWMHPSFVTDNNDVNWNRVWKLSRSEIEYHRNHWQEAKYEPSKNIIEWPANGNTMLGQAKELAPFHDWNNDGLYNALRGDFPEIKGDQAIYFIYNDAREWHAETNGHPINADLQVMYYAYDSPEDSPLHSTIYADYKIINRSDQFYKDFYIAYFVDFDLGNCLDDYIGCDTALHLAYVYNGDEFDGNGEVGEYGFHPPAQGISFLNHKMNSFTYFNQSGGYPVNEPWNAEGYYYYMQALWLDSTHLTHGGNGIGGDEPAMHAYSGNPSDDSSWSEVSVENEPGDRRCVLASGPFDFYPGEILELELAFVFAQETDGNNLSIVDILKQRVGEVREIYTLAPGIGESDELDIKIKIFPNPAAECLHLETVGTPGNYSYAIYNVLGGPLLCNQFIASCTVPLIGFDPGIYFIRITNGKKVTTKKIIKN